MSSLAEHQRIIKVPRITERGTSDQEKNNSYHFLVAPDANKLQIRLAVEKLFGVKVLSVNTMIRKGKPRRKMGRRSQKFWKTSDWKKAVVKLKAGDTVTFQ